MLPTSTFEILRRKTTLNASRKYTNPTPALLGAGTETAPRGLGLGASASDPEAFTVAQHNNFVGHLTRRVVVGGLTLADRVFGVTSATPVGLESPFTDGLEVSVEKAEEIEVEGYGDALNSGTGYLFIGTGQIVTGTTVPNLVSFKDGMLRLTQAGETPNYQLIANNLTPMNAGALRVRLLAIG